MRGVRTRLLLLCAVALAVIGPSLHASPAAAAGSSAACVHRWTDTVTPGTTTSTQRAVFSSHGETGTIQCSGTVQGRQVTGPGTFGEEGVIEASCDSGRGQALFSITLPTSGGPVHLRIPVTFTLGPGTGHAEGDVFPGAFVVRPVQGDCVTTPATEIAVTRFGLLQS
jgi:hypothetical protein